jgi:hypothetical protein
MNPDILLVREDSGYRVLHGHLHLMTTLNATPTESDGVLIEARDEGKVKVIKTRHGIVVEHKTGIIPVLSY